MLRRFTVAGKSMAPTLAPGDRLLTASARHLLRGDLVVVSDPRERSRRLVKRVLSSDGCWIHLAGDNPAASTDSRDFGPVPRAMVSHRVLCRYWPTGAAGRVAGRVQRYGSETPPSPRPDPGEYAESP